MGNQDNVQDKRRRNSKELTNSFGLSLGVSVLRSSSREYACNNHHALSDNESNKPYLNNNTR
jgi:hypothetical protein